MSDRPTDRPPDPVMEKAVDWFVRRDAGALSAAEQSALREWLADARHRAAFAAVERLWADLGRIPSPYRRSSPRATQDSDDHATVDMLSGVDRRPRRRVARLVVASLVVGVCVLVAVGRDLPTRLQADARSEVGETKTVDLPDGSIAVLNTASAIAVRFGPDERLVRLLAGEAEFEVTAEAGRPFRVEAEGGVSTAVGTDFLVRRHDDGATVSVLQGRVRVAYLSDGGPGQETLLAANQRARYAAAGGLSATESIDAQTAAAWRRGKLIFIDRPLAEVVEELERYHPGRIVLRGEELGATTVSGVFATADPAAVVDALESALSLRSTRIANLLIVIHR